MARRVTRPDLVSASSGTRQRPIKVEKSGAKEFFFAIRDVVLSERFRLAVGVMLIAITLMMLVAYISFFFTAK